MTVLGWPKVLTWDNFGKPVPAAPADSDGDDVDCHIETDITYDCATTPVVPGGGFKLKNIVVQVRLIAGDSWVLEGVRQKPNQAAILKHEQGHYNITGIAARDLDKALAALRDSDIDSLLSQAEAMLDSLKSAGKAAQAKYDGSVTSGGTDHGNDVQQQAKWNSKIAAAKSLAGLP